MNKIYFKTNIFFLIFIIFLIAQAFDQTFGWALNKSFPNIYFFTYGDQVGGWNLFIWNENGVIETIQAFILFITIGILLKLYLNKKNLIQNKIIKVFIILNIIFLSYFFLEEISWGQHIFKFETFSFFLDENSLFYNKQEETNFHNTSNLFNEIPRTLVIIWCSLSIIIFTKFNIKNEYWRTIIIPSKKLMIISLLLLLFVLPDFIFENLNIIESNKFLTVEIVNYEKIVKLNYLVMLKLILTFNFFRLSELQELIIVYYFFWHSIFLYKKIIEQY